MKSLRLLVVHMSRRITLAALIGALVLVGTPAPPAGAQGQTFQVDTIEDEDTDDFERCSPDPDEIDCSLRGAIQKANSTPTTTDTIVLGAETYRLDKGSLEITSDLILQGVNSEDSVISGNNQSRVLEISDSDPSITLSVLITNVTIADGEITGLGLKIGGGIKIGAGSTVELKDVVVRDNVAQSSGGIDNHGDLRIFSSTIRDNEADLRVEIDGNRFSGRGGGIRNWEDGTIIIDQSTISRNSATAGAGIYNEGLMSITNSTIESNHTLAHVSSPCFSDDCGDGGGIYQLLGTLRLTNVTITRNLAGRSGAGIFFCSVGNAFLICARDLLLGPITDRGGNVEIAYSTIARNEGPTLAGFPHGIFRYGAEGIFTVQSSIIALNGRNGGNNCDGAPITSEGYNLENWHTCDLDGANDLSDIVSNLGVGFLGSYGGPTETVDLRPVSRAIDHIPVDPNSELCIGTTFLTDQRGETRPQRVGCDIGAFEKPFNLAGILGPLGGSVADAAGSGAALSVEPGVLSGETNLFVDVVAPDPAVSPPRGFLRLATEFVDVVLDPNPGPLPAPGATINLPLTLPLAPGIPLELFRFDPAANALIDTDVLGRVDPGGMTATFGGVTEFSIFVGAEFAVADLEIVSFEALHAPSEILVGTEVEITLRKIITNKGPSAPMNVELTNTALAPADSTVTPVVSTIQEPALGLDEQREVFETFMINCGQASQHTFTFTNEIQPLSPEDTDPNPDNNTVEISHTVECLRPADSATKQTANAYAFADMSDVGDAWLLRNDNGITAQATVYGPEPGVYTMWWIVWNTPKGCSEPYACVEPDLFNPNAGLAIGYAGGVVVGSSGKLQITAHLNEGATLEGFAYPEFQAIGVQLNETTMIDSRHAEIHLVLRSHGEKVPGLVGEALHTFNAACVYNPPITGSEPAYGTPGPNTCVDLYFSVFPSEDAP